MSFELLTWNMFIGRIFEKGVYVEGVFWPSPWLSLTGSKIPHKKMGVEWSIGVLLLWLYYLQQEAGYRAGYAIGIKEKNCYKFRRL